MTSEASSNAIRVRWAGNERVFQPGETVTIGRDYHVAVRLTDERVSHEHLQITHSERGWIMRDRSRLGTYQAGQRVNEAEITGDIMITLGSPQGERVELGLVRGTPPTARPETVPPTETPRRRSPDETAPPDSGDKRPGGPLVPGGSGHGDGTVTVGDVLHVSFAGQTRSLNTGQTLTIGRTEGDLQTVNPAVSRRHATIRYESGQWVIENLSTTGGTYLEGHRIEREALQGSMAFMLGDRAAGERLVTVASGEHKEPMTERVRRANPALLLGVVAAALVLVAAAVGFVAVRGGSDGRPSDAALRRSTVRVVDAQGGSYGSGTVLTKDGLILTNAHVAAPDAPGQSLLYDTSATSPSELLIETPRGENQPTEPAYYAQVVAADGYLDLAVLRITRTYTGKQVRRGDDLGLRPVTIGDPDRMHVSDPIYVMGFPDVNQSVAASFSPGVIAAFTPDARAGSDRGWITTDIQLKGGNSGGFAADRGGRLIGVPTLTQTRRNGDRADRIRSIALAKPLIDAAKKGDSYVSTAVTPLDDATQIDNLRVVGPADRDGTEIHPGSAACSGTGPRRASAVAVSFDYSGFPAEHQDVLFDVKDTKTNKLVAEFSTSDNWPTRWGTKGCAVVTLNYFETPPSGDQLALVISAGPNLDQPIIVGTNGKAIAVNLPSS